MYQTATGDEDPTSQYTNKPKTQTHISQFDDSPATTNNNDQSPTNASSNNTIHNIILWRKKKLWYNKKFYTRFI